MTNHGFELIKETHIAELNTDGKLYRHTATGAELLSLENNDENKCFGITFRTPPDDSTGIAHIMEHSVLNGSRKYPVKEPFVELIKGSMKTFLAVAALRAALPAGAAENWHRKRGLDL